MAAPGGRPVSAVPTVAAVLRATKARPATASSSAPNHQRPRPGRPAVAVRPSARSSSAGEALPQPPAGQPASRPPARPRPPSGHATRRPLALRPARGGRGARQSRPPAPPPHADRGGAADPRPSASRRPGRCRPSRWSAAGSTICSAATSPTRARRCSPTRWGRPACSRRWTAPAR